MSRCVVCGREIYGGYYVDWAGNKVCITHTAEERRLCNSCGCFCGGTERLLGHDRWICGSCHKTRITQREGNSVARYIMNGYRQAGLGEIKGWTLKVSPLQVLVDKMGSPNVEGFAQRIGNEYTVFILRDITKIHFAEILAHEMLHIWMFRRGIAPAQDLCEGFCNLGSYYVLSHIAKATGSQHASHRCELLLKNEDPIYGEGLRKIKRHYDRGGWPAAIEAITDKK